MSFELLTNLQLYMSYWSCLVTMKVTRLRRWWQKRLLGFWPGIELPPPIKNWLRCCLDRSVTGVTNVLMLWCRERGRLIDCYAAFIEKRCGAESRRVLRPLMRMHHAFDFLPPCVGQSLHPVAPTTPPPTSTPEVSAAEPVATTRPTTTTSRPVTNAPSPAAVMSGRPRAVSRDLMTLLCAIVSASLQRTLSMSPSS